MANVIFDTYLFYLAKSSNDLLSTLSTSPEATGPWGPSSAIPGQSSKTGPAVCNTTNGAFLAYVANSDKNDLMTTTQPEGTT